MSGLGHSQRRAASLARMLVLAVAMGLGLALGAVEGFRFGALWTIHLVIPGGTGAPGPEVIPVLFGGLVAAVVGSVLGVALFGVLASLLLRGIAWLAKKSP